MSARALRRLTGWTPGDAVLTVGALLLFVDSFLQWEEICVTIARVAPICVDFWTAWSGRGAFAGAAMAVMSGALVAWQAALVMTATGWASRWLASPLEEQSEPRRRAITVGLATATVVLGVVKLAFVLADHSTYGSYVAVPLLLLIAAGAAMKARAGEPEPR